MNADVVVESARAGDLIEALLQRIFARLGDIVIVLQIGDDAGDLGGNAVIDVAQLGAGIDHQRMIVAIAGGEFGLLARDLGLLGAQLGNHRRADDFGHGLQVAIRADDLLRPARIWRVFPQFQRGLLTSLAVEFGELLLGNRQLGFARRRARLCSRRKFGDRLFGLPDLARACPPCARASQSAARLAAS